jgi:protein phosphatase 1K
MTSSIGVISAVIQKQAGGVTKLVSANIGDARTLLIKSNGKGSYVAQQLTFDHVPDETSERERIEKFNPNPKMPLVRYIAGTWRVGGLLALSRAFGDAYLKGSQQFEGIAEGSDGYSSGFGVISEPTIETVDLSGGC